MDPHAPIYDSIEENPAWLNDDDPALIGFDHDPSEDQEAEPEHQTPADHLPPEGS